MKRRGRVYWTQRARRELLQIGDFIARDDPAAARAWIDKLRARARIAAAAARGGRRVPELQRDDTREVFLRTYRIVYRLRAEGIDVLTVFEGHQRFPKAVR